MIITILLFLIILGVLVVIHEAGHFFAAKLSRVRVDEFGIGFPPRLFTRKRGETIYSINLLPLGGFVRIAGENGEIDSNDVERSFPPKPFWVKERILLAGVVINWLFAALLFGILQTFGAPVAISDTEAAASADVTITEVVEKSPAKDAGFTAGDAIVEMRTEGEEVHPATIGEVQRFLREHAGTPVNFIISRNDVKREVVATPRENPPPGEGALGVALARIAWVSHPWYEAPWRGVFVTASLTISLTGGIFEILSDLFLHGQVAQGVAGPVGIAALTGQVRTLGALFVLNFMAILSLNLALLNALPVLPLDGGRALLAAVERIFRRTIPIRAMALVNSLGFAILILAIIAITVRDIRHLLV